MFYELLLQKSSCEIDVGTRINFMLSNCCTSHKFPSIFRIFSVWWTDLCYEIWFVDVWWFSGEIENFNSSKFMRDRKKFPHAYAELLFVVYMAEINVFNFGEGSYMPWRDIHKNFKYALHVWWIHIFLYLMFAFSILRIMQVDLRHIDELNGTNIVDVGIDLSEFYTSVEWDILEVPAVRFVEDISHYSFVKSRLTHKEQFFFFSSLSSSCIIFFYVR